LYSDKAIIGEKMIGYYAERARGGVGAIVIEGAAVHDTTMKFPNYLAAHRPEITKSLDALAAALDPYDCRPILQIAHSGSRMSSHDSRLPLWAPSDVRSAISPEIPHAMTKREIRDVISGYVAAARNVARSGIAGIEVHSAHEYLLGQFLSPLNNKRTDEYGGSFDNRIRLLVQVLEAVRTELGDSKVMGIRINGSDLTPGGPQNEEYVQIAAAVCALSDLDYVSVSAGTSRNNEMIVPPMDVPQGVYIEYAANIRAAIPVPVFGVGRVKRPEHAEQILASGRIDVIAEETRRGTRPRDPSVHRMQPRVLRIPVHQQTDHVRGESRSRARVRDDDVRRPATSEERPARRRHRRRTGGHGGGSVGGGAR
jgi:2,4-dienoyl-CoA reductase-like NADH-dependent reductase (Old Yellow Enzyme family)